MGFVVTDRFELFFDTVETTRKVQNLRRNPKIAFVIGGLTGGDERTVQYEGLADEPSGAELARTPRDDTGTGDDPLGEVVTSGHGLDADAGDYLQD